MGNLSVEQRAAALSQAASANAASENKVEKSDVTQSTVVDNSAVGQGASVGNSVAASAATKTAADAYANESNQVRAIVDMIEKYAINMAKGKRLTPTDVLTNQSDLVRTLEQLVNLPNSADFAVCFRRLLTVADENRESAFGSDAIHRRISELKKGDTFVTNYVRFMDMVLAFSDSRNRVLYIRRYNLNASVQFIKQQYRERCIEFIRAISGAQ